MIRSQDDFIRARRPDWEALDKLLNGRRANVLPAEITRAAALYRAVCADVMRARAAGFSPEVVALLDALAARGHGALYRSAPYRWGAVWDLIRRDFPRTVRRYRWYVALSACLFLLPALFGFTGARMSRPFGLRIVPAAMAEQMEQGYAEGFNKGRDEGTDAGMAGFYVYNNVGIAFRCFATGILFGLGSLFFLVQNGLLIGTVFGLVTAAGHGRNIFTFASGHSSFELTAIVIAGAAGLVMGYSLVETEGMTRWGSLRRRAPDVARLVLGAALLLLVAAALEAFWSPSAAPERVKWTVAAVLAASMTTYLTRAGRSPTP